MSTPQKKPKSGPSDIDIYVGERIKIRRRTLGLSQTDMAKSLDVSFQQIQKYERGLNRISAGRLYELSKFLNVPINFFFDGYAEEGVSEENIPDLDIDQKILQENETAKLVSLYGSIEDPGFRKSLLSLMKSMVSSE